MIKEISLKMGFILEVDRIVFFDNFQSVSRKFGIFESHSNNNNLFTSKDILNFGAFYYVTKVTELNGLRQTASPKQGLVCVLLFMLQCHLALCMCTSTTYVVHSNLDIVNLNIVNFAI